MTSGKMSAESTSGRSPEFCLQSSTRPLAVNSPAGFSHGLTRTFSGDYTRGAGRRKIVRINICVLTYSSSGEVQGRRPDVGERWKAALQSLKDVK